jgi:hypothetical protein
MHEPGSVHAPDAILSNGELVRMDDGMSAMFMIAAGQGELSAREYFPLNGNSDEIRAANNAAGLVLTRDNAADYVRFFTTFLRMDDGEPFVIVESLNGFRLVNDDKPDQQKPEDMRFVCMGETVDGDAFVLMGYMTYHDELFGVSMRVHKNGDVEMVGDDPMGLIVRLQ